MVIIFNKINKKIIVLSFITIIFFINVTIAFGETKIDRVDFIPKSIEKTTNGANVDLSVNKADDYEVNVNVNTKNLDKGYYSTYLYENENRDLSNYEAIAFDIENEGETPIRINLNITENSQTVLSLSEKSSVLMKKEDSEMLEIAHPSYGTIEIAPNFKGTLYIPFNGFCEKDKINSDGIKAISKISSWGIVATLSEDEEVSFKLSKFSLIQNGSDIGKYSELNFSIKGDEIVQIPVAGESISDYTVDFGGKNPQDTNVKFQLKQAISGITLSNKGRLTLTESDIDPQKIQICAVLDNNISLTTDIQLMKSWTLEAKEVDGTSKSIPKSDEVAKIISNDNNILMNPKMLVAIRISVILCAIGFGVLYRSWKNQRK